MDFLRSYRVWAAVAGVAMVASIIGVTHRPWMASPYVSVEGFQLWYADGFDDEVLKLVRESEAAAARGDLPSALEFMLRAETRNHEQPTPQFELWDNLAELYCASAASETDTTRAKMLRSKGLALLREFRCGADLFDFKLRCKDVPNRDGLCFRNLCDEDSTEFGKWDGFMDAEPAPGSFTWYLDDKKNLSAIERICRR